MRRRVKLADACWEAANYWLHPGSWAGDCVPTMAPGASLFSCNALGQAFEGSHSAGAFSLPKALRELLKELGCNSQDSRLLDHVPFGSERQSVRYMWLLLLMHYAQDEDLVYSYTPMA